MGRTSKPYRRFKARGGPPVPEGASPEAALEGVRALTREESKDVRAVATPPPVRRPAPSAAPGRLEREQKRALARARRRWWSLSGLGAGGWIARAALVLLLGVVVWAGLGFLALRGAVSEANGRVTDGARQALDPAGGMLSEPTNTLIIGSDARRGQTRSRADTLLIMRTDPDGGHVKYLSIPRDWRVELPGQGVQKINASFFFLGQRGAINAVKRLTGLPIHHIMVIKFGGFPRLVDEVGGIEVVNPSAIVDCPYPGGRTVSFPKGRIELDGARALEYSRVRRCDGDLNRALRQQAVMSGLKSKVASLRSLPFAPWRGAAVVRTMNTDIGTVDMVKLGWLQTRLGQRPQDRVLLTGESQTIGGVSYVVGTDPDQNEREIARFVASD